jgi:hypothetical protein
MWRTVRISTTAVVALCGLAFVCGSVHADTFDVTGSSVSGGTTISGTITGDAALSTVTSADLLVSGETDPFTVIQSYSNGVLALTDPLSLYPEIFVYLSAAAQQGIEDDYQGELFQVGYDDSGTSCQGVPSCYAGYEALLQAAIAALDVEYNSDFAATPTATATPLPAALPLFATGLGALRLFGWRRRRFPHA